MYIVSGGALNSTRSLALYLLAVQILIQDVVFPLLCHSSADEQLWHSDPVEYIRTKYGRFYAEFCHFFGNPETLGNLAKVGERSGNMCSRGNLIVATQQNDLTCTLFVL